MDFNNVKDNRVLIVEPNPYHGEILPGFVKYFRDLGFSTDLLLRSANKVDDIFCRFKIKPRVISGSAEKLKKFLKSDIINKYKYVFFSSSAFWETDFCVDSYLNYLGFVPNAKNGIMMVEHNIEPYLKEYNEEEYLHKNRLFTLSGFHDTPMLNPHFFGENVKITRKSDKVIKFVAVGRIGRNCKNHDILISAVSELSKKNYKFKVTVIGIGKLKIPKELKKYIDFKGHLSYKRMYSEIEKADYILPLLDYSIEDHHRYINGTTTGNRQLIMGFLKPCIIEEPFAAWYGFNNQNAIIYKDNNLADGMIQGIELSGNDYSDLQNNLKNLENEIYKISLENLKKAVEHNV